MTNLQFNGHSIDDISELRDMVKIAATQAESSERQILLNYYHSHELHEWLREDDDCQVQQLAEELEVQCVGKSTDTDVINTIASIVLKTENITSFKPSFGQCFEVVNIDNKLDEDTTTITLQLRVKASYNENYELKVVSVWGTKGDTINPSQFEEGSITSLSFVFHKRAGIAWAKCTLFAEEQEIGQVTAANSDILTFNVNKVSFEMIKVEGGTFTMGATSEQGSDALDDEKPKHRVTLSDYYIGKYEVTQELWEAVMKTTIYQQRDKHRKSSNIYGDGEQYPMYYISWDECQEFISKLNSLLSSQLGGKRFALPTEAQWEYAARDGQKDQEYADSNPSYFKASTKPVELVRWDKCQTFISKSNTLLFSQFDGKRFAQPTETQWEFAAHGGKKSQGHRYAGSDMIDDVAWYKDNSGSGTHAVGTKAPNELGLYDMSGNVYEWCLDWYGSYSSSSEANPTGSSRGECHIFRGGSWSSHVGGCRVSYRNYNTPSYCNYDLGFRLVLLP